MTAPLVAYGQERVACAVASEMVGGSSARVNVAPAKETCVVTSGPLVEEGKAAGGLLDTPLAGQVEAGRGERQSPDPVEGNLGLGPGLVVR